jgi:uncharacterized UBP type Zn finger protein
MGLGDGVGPSGAGGRITTIEGQWHTAPMDQVCDHLTNVNEVTPSAAGCEDCLRTGSWWVHLRLCQTCGHVGCCDESPNRHATAHYAATSHPVISSFEPDEHWMWCFVDEVGVEI